jgi:asparagine synthase (glutamine-hydrolysing)
LDAEIRVAQLPWYDVLRADRTTASNGLEIRVPFLCKNLIRYAFSINPDFHNPRINKIEKKILRDAFHNYANENWQVIISRPKEAFSDGVGYSWKKGITDWAESNVSDEMMRDNGWCCPNPKTKEAYLYRSWYESYYPETYLVPHYWMPSWADHGDDPSATVLNIHKEMID